MYCPECGTKNVDTARFCQSCGTKLPQPEQPAPTPVPAPPVPTPVQEPVQPPVSAPVETPVQAPMQAPVETPTQSVVQTPEQPVVQTPVSPVQPPAPAEVAAEAPVPAAPVQEAAPAAVAVEAPVLVATVQPTIPQAEAQTPFTPPPIFQAPAVPQPVYQPAPKQKMKPLTKVLLVVAAILVVAAAGLYILVSQLNDPVRTVEGFFNSVMTGDYSKAYSYLNVPDTPFTSEEAFLDIVAGAQDEDREKYTIRDIRLKDSYDDDAAYTEYTVYYTAGTSTKILTADVPLAKPQTKWLILKTYKVDMTTGLCEEVTIEVPAKAEVYVGKIRLTADLKSDKSTGNVDVYTIPVMFKGSYMVKVKTDFLPEFEKGFYVSDNTTFSATEFNLSDATRDGLLGKTEQMVKDLFDGASKGKDFDDFKGRFATKDPRVIQDMEENYEDIAEWISGDSAMGVTISEVKVSNCEIVSMGTYDAAENIVKLDVSYDLNYTAQYMSYWDDEMVEEPGSVYMSSSASFAYEDGAWVLVSLNL